MAKVNNATIGWPEGCVTAEQRIEHCRNVLAGKLSGEEQVCAYPEGHNQVGKIMEQIAKMQQKIKKA